MPEHLSVCFYILIHQCTRKLFGLFGLDLFGFSPDISIEFSSSSSPEILKIRWTCTGSVFSFVYTELWVQWWPDSLLRLKADRPHSRNYPHMPTDYRHTDKHLRLVMTLTALYCIWHSRGQPTCQISRSKVKRFSRERWARQTDATKYIIS